MQAELTQQQIHWGHFRAVLLVAACLIAVSWIKQPQDFSFNLYSQSAVQPLPDYNTYVNTFVPPDDSQSGLSTASPVAPVPLAQAAEPKFMEDLVANFNASLADSSKTDLQLLTDAVASAGATYASQLLASNAADQLAQIPNFSDSNVPQVLGASTILAISSAANFQTSPQPPAN